MHEVTPFLKFAHKYLLRGLVTTKNGSKLRKAGGLSYIWGKEVVMLEAIGIDKWQFGLHRDDAAPGKACVNSWIEGQINQEQRQNLIKYGMSFCVRVFPHHSCSLRDFFLCGEVFLPWVRLATCPKTTVYL